MNKYTRGSNQYKLKSKWTQSTYLWFVLWFTVLGIGWFARHQDFLIPQKAEANLITPIPVSTTPTPTVAANGAEGDREYSRIRSYIVEVFGQHSDKAFKVLSCENASLNPDAVNTAGNYPEGSRDIGVFQISEYWQGVHSKFLFDPELNVRIAYKIFKDSGYSFKMWTCGKKLGI